MNAFDLQSCDDFSTSVAPAGKNTAMAAEAANKFGITDTFKFNRFTQGFIHAARGDDNAYPDNADYSFGYDCGAAV